MLDALGGLDRDGSTIDEDRSSVVSAKLLLRSTAGNASHGTIAIAKRASTDFDSYGLLRPRTGGSCARIRAIVCRVTSAAHCESTVCGN